MAKDSSFDVVSIVNMQEIDNAYQQTIRELSNRYDLKQTNSSIEFSRSEKTFTINAPADFVAHQIIDILNSKLIKRGLDIKVVRWEAPQSASGDSIRIFGKLIEGIDQDIAKKISKDIKNLKYKCKVAIESDKLRVTSASRDTLQDVISYLKDQDYGQPLQFNNYR